jgi:hypothetical protein
MDAFSLNIRRYLIYPNSHANTPYRKVQLIYNHSKNSTIEINSSMKDETREELCSQSQAYIGDSLGWGKKGRRENCEREGGGHLASLPSMRGLSCRSPQRAPRAQRAPPVERAPES